MNDVIFIDDIIRNEDININVCVFWVSYYFLLLSF